MSDDKDVGFKVIASIDGLKDAMSQGTAAVKGFADKSKEHVETVAGAFETLNKVMVGFAAVLAGGLIFKEIIEGTEKWTDSVRSLSKQFGTTTEEASGLAAALKNIGSSSEEYGAAAQKLDRQVKSNEDRVNALGVVTRDSSGNLLSQQQIMLNAISTLNQYKEGTDRNIAAQFLLGRGAGDLQKLLRLTSDELKTGADDAAKFGLVVSGEAADGGRRFQHAIAELNLAITGMQVSLGEKIIPALTDLAQVFTNKIIPAVGLGIDKFREFTDALGQLYARVLVADDPELAAALDDVTAERANPSKAPQKEEPKVEGGGTKTIPKGFGKTDTTAADQLKEDIAMAKLEVSTTEQLGKTQLQNKKDILAAQVELGRISKEEEIQGLKEVAEQEYQLDLDALEQEQQIDGLSVVEKQRINDQILVLQAKHTQEMNKLNLDSIKEQRQQYDQYFAVLNNGFKQMITGVLQGTQTWQQAFAHMFTNILASFAGFLEEKAAKWAENQLFEMILGQTTAGAESLTAISASAAQAGAAAYASTAAIPVVGPELAPAAAAAAYSGAMAFAGTIPAAASGYDVPFGVNPLTQLHQEEMVLPAPLANAVRNMANGGSTNGAGDTHHWHISTLDGASTKRFFMDNGAHLAASLKTQARNANPNVSHFTG